MNLNKDIVNIQIAVLKHLMVPGIPQGQCPLMFYPIPTTKAKNDLNEEMEKSLADGWGRKF